MYFSKKYKYISFVFLIHETSLNYKKNKMSYYLFPKANSCNIQIQNTKNDSIIISPSLNRYLNELNSQILSIRIEYEYLQNEMHPYYKGILANGPDESYYEITEIMYTMRINAYLDFYVAKNIQILNLGSNSNAILHSRKHLGRNDINNCDLSIFQFSNLFHKMHIIFADYMSDIRNMLIRLCTILVYQAKNGVLIWKIGDCFTPLMLDIIYFISSFYHKIYFIKPTIMDVSKSEKYLVCKGFCPYEINYIEKIMSLYHTIANFKEPIYRILLNSIPFFFLNKLEEINTIMGQVQLEQIHTILLLVGNKFKQEKIQYMSKMNTQKCMEWMNKHKVTYLHM